MSPVGNREVNTGSTKPNTPVIATWSTLRSANLCPASHVAHSPSEFAILKLQSSFLHKNHSKFNFQLIGDGFMGLLMHTHAYDRENAILRSHSDNIPISFHQLAEFTGSH